MRRNTYTYQQVKRGELTALFGFAGALLFILLLTWVGGCEHGANIPIDVDPCMIPGVEECAPECEDNTHVLEGLRDELEYQRERAYECRLLLENFECPPVVIVYPEPGEVECDLTIPVGHRPHECRKGN